jgi:hypothetical protein
MALTSAHTAFVSLSLSLSLSLCMRRADGGGVVVLEARAFLTNFAAKGAKVLSPFYSMFSPLSGDAMEKEIATAATQARSCTLAQTDKATGVGTRACTHTVPVPVPASVPASVFVSMCGGGGGRGGGGGGCTIWRRCA